MREYASLKETSIVLPDTDTCVMVGGVVLIVVVAEEMYEVMPVVLVYFAVKYKDCAPV